MQAQKSALKAEQKKAKNKGKKAIEKAKAAAKATIKDAQKQKKQAAKQAEGKQPWSFKDWYTRHGKELNKKRRQKYKNDPKYKDRVLALNREHRERDREIRIAEHGAEAGARKVSPPSSWREVEKVIEGKEETLLTIGAVSRLLHRSPQSIRQYEKKGIVQETKHRDDRGTRMYTPAQILSLYKAVKHTDIAFSAEDKADPTPMWVALQHSNGSTETIAAYRVGTLSKAVGKTVLTLEQLERKGVFPETPIRHPDNGHRYYTTPMIEAVAKAVNSVGAIRLRGTERQKKFFDDVTTAWTALGIVGSKVISVTHPDEIEAVKSVKVK